MKITFCLTFKIDGNDKVFGNSFDTDTDDLYKLHRELDLLKLGAIQSVEKALCAKPQDAVLIKEVLQ